MINQKAKENFEKYLKESKSGDPYRMSIVANCYMNGIGVEKDGKLGSEWYEKAISSGKGNTEAFLSNYALCYLNGQGVEKNVKKAEQLLKQSLKIKESSTTHFILGKLYFNNGQSDKDLLNAAWHFIKAKELMDNEDLANVQYCEEIIKQYKDAYNWAEPIKNIINKLKGTVDTLKLIY